MMVADEIDHGSRAGAGVILGGGVAITLAALLPWASVSTVTGTQTVVGTDGPDGKSVLLIGGAIAATGLGRLVRKHEPSWVQIFPMLGALWVGYIGWWHIQFAQNKFAEYTAQYPQYVGSYALPSVGGGLYLILIGAIAALIGASTQAKVDHKSLAPIPYYIGMHRFLDFTKMQAEEIAGKLHIDTKDSYSPEFFHELRDRWLAQGHEEADKPPEGNGPSVS
ncbi:MAG TPA: hypothetical protein VE196_09920 [Pseudonocardiaceae bacterium]|nr:hypothetical protein [Pseudonocardiaceae bacterium]